MADKYYWPEREKRDLIGRRISRLDGPVKVTGRAKYSYDVNREGMLYARFVTCPYAHAKVVSVDVEAARSMPGVEAVRIIQDVGSEIKWALDEVAVLAAETEEIARDAVEAIRFEYEVLEHFVTEEDRDSAPEARAADAQVEGKPDEMMAAADVKVEGTYRMAPISHACLEAHGQVCEWDADGKMTAWCSTQAVSRLPNQFSQALKIPAGDVRILTPYMGGGFGSKFGIDRWGVECGELARETGRPVKLMLERDSEMTVAGDRPSAFAKIKVGCQKDGRIQAWESESWGSGGPAGTGSTPIPYVFRIPDRRHQHTSIPTNIASSRAWRAPNHPQACFLTMSALEDAAAALNMDPLQFLRKNLHMTGRLAATYEQEFSVAAKLMDWEEKWRPRSQSEGGPVRRGLGLSVHTWGGRGHASQCEVSVHPDGLVQARIGTQDLGTGTRTVMAIILADTFGLKLEDVRIDLGDSRYPQSGPSGGSTTVGGVSSSTRMAAQDALSEVFNRVAPELGVEAGDLEAWRGRIRSKTDPSKSLSWKDAAAKIGVTSIVVMGLNPRGGPLTNSSVGGVQMADVSVDIETGVVKVNKMVAVQDCGLIVDLKTAETQVYGALIMGIAYALTEEKITDPVTGRMLNADMEFYKLPGLLDIGELEVHMMTGPGYDDRGVIGLGEPPVISPGAALANAVANAIGVRVPYLPLTSERVINALEKGGVI